MEPVEYKIVSRHTRFLSESAMNDLGLEGWRLIHTISENAYRQYIFMRNIEACTEELQKG